MGATLNLLPRKEFEIILDENTIIKGHFGTWAISRFCQRKGIDFATLVTTDFSKFGIDAMLEMVLSAVEEVARKGKAAFSYTDLDAANWFDELGGLGGKDVGRLLAHMNSEDELKTPPDNGADSAKKNEASPSENYSETSTLAAEA